MSAPITDTIPLGSGPSPQQEICMQIDNQTLYRQSIVPAPSSTSFPPITTTTPVPPQPYGNNILVFIPTENKFKTQAITSTISSKLGEDARSRLVIHSQNIDSGVGNQPYDEAGVEGAYTRIRNALAWLDGHRDFLGERKIGTVLVGAIENYIQRSSEKTSAVDYGVVVLFNATSGQLVGGVSRGVTVPQAFLEEAEVQGFDDDGDGRKSGKVTVGSVLAKRFGVDKADWHRVVCAVSRYDILSEALDRLGSVGVVG